MGLNPGQLKCTQYSEGGRKGGREGEGRGGEGGGERGREGILMNI